MSAAYGGTGQALQYTATAVFDFSTTASEGLALNLLSDNVVGIGFDSLELQVAVDGTSLTPEFFSSLASAETFFADDTLALGAIAAGSQSVSLTYDLTYNSGTLAKAGDGFGFTYELVDPPVASVPEPSTWAMMLMGLAGLGYAAFRRAAKGDISIISA
jgi:hypothetical protein